MQSQRASLERLATPMPSALTPTPSAPETPVSVEAISSTIEAIVVCTLVGLFWDFVFSDSGDDISLVRVHAHLVFLTSVPLAGIAASCTVNQNCRHANAVCWKGQCLCQNGFYERDSRCSTCSSTIPALHAHSISGLTCCSFLSNPVFALLLAVSMVALDRSCLANPVCLDDNAQCSSGTCSCRENFEVRGRFCSKNSCRTKFKSTFN